MKAIMESVWIKRRSIYW